jgi:energy-coupling factor transport system ATP-binding protein
VRRRTVELAARLDIGDALGEYAVNYSMGMKKKLALVCAMLHQPAVLILDEPTTGLDYREQRRMMDLLARLHGEGMTLVVITHTPWVVAQYAQRGVLMQAGRMVFDGPLRELFANQELLEQCHFRVPVVTRLGRRLGFTPLSVEELLAAVRDVASEPRA